MGRFWPPALVERGEGGEAGKWGDLFYKLDEANTRNTDGRPTVA
jgi:hypothetical protein